MQSISSLASTDVYFNYNSNLAYRINPASATFYPTTGFVHIWGLLTPAGSAVDVTALGGGTYDVYVSNSFKDHAGNTVAGLPVSHAFPAPPYTVTPPFNK